MSGPTTRAGELLQLVHANPGITRAEAARLIGIGTGAATDLVSRLTAAELIGEQPATKSGARGRPTTALVPHSRGPLVLAGSITQESWQVDVVELGGATVASADHPHDGQNGEAVVRTIGAAVTRFRAQLAGRIRAFGLAVPGIVTKHMLLEANGLGWRDVDLTAAWPDAEVFVTGNDATLAATAESRRGAGVGTDVALHLRVAGGLGGALVDAGRVLAGSGGAAGEFGHMPFGDPSVRCPCGALGCWGTAVDGSALARLLGQPAPPDPITYSRRIIGLARQRGHPAEARAVRQAATSLGRGIGGLVNGLDPDLVTLSGLGADLLAAAPEAIHRSYLAGLMRFRQAAPPQVLPAALGENGPIAGAAEEAWTRLLTRLPVAR